MPAIFSLVRDPIPSKEAEGANVRVRSNSYGELAVQDYIALLASEGQHFRACNGTPGTGIAMGIRTTFSDTADVLALIRNTAALSSGKSVYLDYIRLINTVAGASTTESNIALVIENANRYASGGTALTEVGCNTTFAPTINAEVFFGIITASAAGGGKRIVGRARLKTQATPCWVVGDQVLLTFRGMGAAATELNGTASRQIVIPFGPIVLGPNVNHSFLLHMWNVANAVTAPSWEVEIGWWEK